MANELRNLFGEGACSCDAVGRHSADEHNANLAYKRAALRVESDKFVCYIAGLKYDGDDETLKQLIARAQELVQ